MLPGSSNDSNCRPVVGPGDLVGTLGGCAMVLVVVLLPLAPVPLEAETMGLVEQVVSAAWVELDFLPKGVPGLQAQALVRISVLMGLCRMVRATAPMVASVETGKASIPLLLLKIKLHTINSHAFRKLLRPWLWAVGI